MVLNGDGSSLPITHIGSARISTSMEMVPTFFLVPHILTNASYLFLNCRLIIN